MASKLSKMSPILEKTNKQPAVMNSYQYFYLKQKKIVANCKVVKAMQNDAVVLFNRSFRAKPCMIGHVYKFKQGA